VSEAEPCDVLVVDDDPDIRDALKDALGLSGYGVVAFGDAREALLWLEHGGQPAVIILDLMMPGMTGWEFRAELEARPQLSEVPVVVLTGAREEADLHVEAQLTKPVDLQVLLDQVERCQSRPPPPEEREVG
jgi:CheY-like chemotaxis protein